MKPAPFIALVLLPAALLAWAVAVSFAAVAIVEDEVVFSIAAPGANEVYLVGDFNNWNPTYEKMEARGGRFEVRLFLLPGTYRYKFVVDGEWISDPDNLPADPSGGSVVAIVERAGALAFADELPEAEAAGTVLLEPAVRYSGAFFLDHGDTRSTQALDVWVFHRSDKVRAMADLKTVDDTWSASPLRAEVLFDRGHLDLTLDDGEFKAFENDSIWSSLDPFRVVGDVGVYGYNAGFERRGASARFPFVLNTKLRGFYTDKIGERPGPPLAVEAGAFAGFEESAARDTLVYRYANTFEDEDAWAVEFAGDMGSFDFGYVKRSNKGYQPGSLAEVMKSGTGFETAVYATREFWNADVGWLTWRFYSRLSAVAGFGRATTGIRSSSRYAAFVEEIGDLGIAQFSETFERTFTAQEDTRWSTGLEWESGGGGASRGTARALFTRSEYDFEGVYALSRATVSDLALEGSFSRGTWRASGTLRYLDQDYGGAPEDFHYFLPQKNAWLDYRDKLTVGRMAAFDLEKSVEIEASARWGERSLSALPLEGEVARSAAMVSAGVVSRGVLETIEYAFVRAGLEYALSERFFLQGDARLSHYNKRSWNLEDTFFSAYGEAGFRNRRMEITVGVGLDPVVLDPVTNLYSDIGREEFLRAGIPAGLTRGAAAELGEGLERREAALENYGAVKLEIILAF